MSRAKQLADAIKAQPERELASRVFVYITPILSADDLEKLAFNLMQVAARKRREE